MRVALALALLVCLLPTGARADNASEEIDYLLDSIGSSNCTFIRNGERCEAQDAESHLRMKYRYGKRYASTSENFISRLASARSFSKKLYYIACEGEEKVPSGDWLTQKLDEYRVGAGDKGLN